ncbi:MAG TPA: hypothetical protein VH640_06280 [Bryobacteraceae bacterium]|jgi:hypothetical protein
MTRLLRASALSVALYLFCNSAARAQFKEIGPAPFSPAVARQRIRTLLDQVDSSNRQRTLDTLNGWTPWFRNVLDEELIAGWKRDTRQRVALVLEPLATEPVADGVVEFSWRQRTDATLNPEHAPLLEHLMTRYPRSGDVFLSDLLAPTPPELSPVQVETVCRILLDMPDLGTWHQSALQILPRYRATTERLLAQDKQNGDQEKSYRAQVWQAELRGETPGFSSQASLPHRRATAAPPAPRNNNGPLLFPPPSASPRSPAEQRSETIAVNRPPAPSPSLAVNPVPPPAPDPPRSAPLPAAPAAYQGPRSGTLECTGAPVPQNAEYVFRNLPPVAIELDYDRKVWDARLVPAENHTQKLILKNKSSGPQKKCVVHWSAIP